MKFSISFVSILLLVSLASASLPLSRATKLIFDQGYLLFESNEEFQFNYFFYAGELNFSFRDQTTRMGTGAIGGSRMGGPPKADLKKMSFVLELVGSALLPPSSKDEDQVWYRESSASLLDKVEQIFGNVAIRELHASERGQMNKFKRSHDASHKLKVVYQNGTTHIQTNVEANAGLDFSVDFGTLRLSSPIDPEDPISLGVWGIEGKSFVIEDAAKGNCDSLESLGLEGHCFGNVWIERL